MIQQSELRPEKKRKDLGRSGPGSDHSSRYMAPSIMQNEEYPHNSNYHQF